MNPLIEKGEELARVKSQGLAIVNRCRAEQRGFTGAEKAELDRITRHAADLQAEVDSLNQVRTVAPGAPRGAGMIGLTNDEVSRYSLAKAILASAENRLEGTFEGECSRAAAQKLGKSPKGFILPEDIAHHEVRTTGGATQLVGTTGIGGYLVATDLSSSLIDLMRNRLVCEALGATTMTGLVGNVAIPTITADPTVYWVAEDTDTTVSHFHTGQISLTPHTVGAAVAISRRLLLQSSIDVETFVRREFARVLATEIDRAALAGTGTGEPYGILHTTGVNTSPMSASTNANAVPTWTNLLGFVSELATDNADFGSLGWAINPQTWAYLAGAVKVTTAQGGFLLDGGTIAGFRALISNQVPSNLTVKAGGASAVIFGNWSMMTLAFWSGVDILVNPYKQSLSGTVEVSALQDVDVGIRQPTAFCIATDVDFS